MERFSIDKMSVTCKRKRQKIDIEIVVNQPNYSRWVFCELFLFLFILWFPCENYLLTCRGTRISAIENSVFSSVSQVQEFGIQELGFEANRQSEFGVRSNYRFRNWLSLSLSRYSVPFKVQWFEIPAHPRFRLSAFRIRDSRFWHYVLLHWSVNRVYVPQNMLYCRLIG